MYQLASRIAAVGLIAAAGFVATANAQDRHRGGGGGGPPAAAAPAPRAAPPAAAPHISAPAPRAAAPAPRISAPQMAAPRSAPPRAAAPHIASPSQHVSPRANVPQIARGHGRDVGGGTAHGNRQAIQRGAAPHVADAPRQPRGAERRLSRGPASGPNVQTQGRRNTGNARDLARQHGPATNTPPNNALSTNRRSPNAPSTVGVAGAGGREHGLRALTPSQRSFVDRSQRQGTRLNTRGTPVLSNPALAGMSRRDPSTRRLADATFRGNFAEHYRGSDRGRDRFRHHGRNFAVVLGWAGPVFWPYAYDDFVDYTFYPVAYDVFWPYAYDDVYDSILGEFAYGEPSGGTASGGSRSARSRTRQAQSGSGGGRPQVCSAQAPTLIDLPIQRITQTVQPDDNQRAALDDLKDAIAKAVNVLQSACPTDVPTSPVGRIEVMRTRLEVMLQAVQIVRPALEKFYDALNDEQKERFNAMAVGENQAQQAQRDLSQVCSERATGAGGLPIDRIERVLRLSDNQRARLEDLNKASLQAADQLKADCPTDQPVTPVARLQAMEQRLSAMLQAIGTVQPALAAFYNSLNDEQKARFNTLNLQQA